MKGSPGQLCGPGVRGCQRRVGAKFTHAPSQAPAQERPQRCAIDVADFEQSAFGQQKRPDARRGDLRALGTPFQHLRLRPGDIRPPEGWNQQLRSGGGQRRNDHPVRLQIGRDGLHRYPQPLGLTNLPLDPHERYVETGCSAHLLG